MSDTNNKIPTAESMLDISFGDNVALRTKISNVMIAFAKLHVEAALKAANENSFIYMLTATDDSARFPVIDEDSILNAYPLQNIK